MDNKNTNQFILMKQKRFLPLFLTQFLGAANDNIFKFALTLLITFNASQYTTLSTGLAVNLIAAIFILPFLLFSATSGQLSDKYDKTTIMRGVKALEVVIMLIALAGMYYHSFNLLMICIFLLGTHSTLFGPAKYAYLPQHLEERELVGGNGLIEMGTFVAILAGTIAGGLLVQNCTDIWISIVALILAGIGFISSLFIPPTPAPNPNLKVSWNSIKVSWNTIKLAKQNTTVFLSLLGISWLWFYGAVFLTQFAPFAKDTLHANGDVVTLLLAVFSSGIAIGSILCERMSGHKVEIGLVPFGAIGMSVFGIDLYLSTLSLVAHTQPYTLTEFITTTSHYRLLADLFLLAMFSGFYSVPLYALIQTRTDNDCRAQIIAANNIMNAAFMIVSAGFAAGLLASGAKIEELFLTVAIMNAAVAIFIFKLVPEFLIRFIAWMLIHTVYRVKKVADLEIPDEGSGLIIANHVSFVDAIIIMATTSRPIIFVMDHNIFKIPFMNFIFKHARAIPIASAKENQQILDNAYIQISKELNDGNLVCIFPEGGITPNGELQKFKGGILKVLDSNPNTPIYPLALNGLWGSFFSRSGGKAMSLSNLKLKFPSIEVKIGTPVKLVDGDRLNQLESEILKLKSRS